MELMDYMNNQETIPCKQCITFAICRLKPLTTCKELYDYLSPIREKPTFRKKLEKIATYFNREFNHSYPFNKEYTIYWEPDI